MAITEYKVIQANGVERLGQLVTASIGDGYQPFGTVIEFSGGDVGQAMIQGTPDGGSTDGPITLKNSDGTITRDLTVTGGVATLEETDTIVGDGDAIVVQNSAASVSKTTTVAVAAGLLGAAKLAATSAIVDNSATIAIQNSAGADAHNATAAVAAGVISNAKLAATVAMIDNADTIVVKNSTGSVTNNATATIAAGVLTQAAFPATVAFIANGATVQVETSANTDPHAATCQVSLGVLTVANLASTVAMVDNGDSIPLQTNAGVVSTGTAGLNSPAAAIVAAGVITAVKAAA